MKTLLSTSRNHSLNRIDANGKVKLIATTECVLTLAEPKYAVIEGNKLAKYPDTETVRFHTSSDTLRQLAREFEDWADELDETFGDLETPIDDEDDEPAGPTVEELIANPLPDHDDSFTDTLDALSPGERSDATDETANDLSTEMFGERYDDR